MADEIDADADAAKEEAGTGSGVVKGGAAGFRAARAGRLAATDGSAVRERGAVTNVVTPAGAPATRAGVLTGPELRIALASCATIAPLAGLLMARFGGELSARVFPIAIPAAASAAFLSVAALHASGRLGGDRT